jgi:methanogenic corrinoid protein MtbC1
MSKELFEKMAQSIIDGDADVAAQLAEQSIRAGVDPLEAIGQGFVVGVNRSATRLPTGTPSCPSW